VQATIEGSSVSGGRSASRHHQENTPNITYLFLNQYFTVVRCRIEAAKFRFYGNWGELAGDLLLTMDAAKPFDMSSFRAPPSGQKGWGAG
jgi:hypothetical protein